MKKKIFGIIICILLITTVVPSVGSLKDSKINLTVQNSQNTSTLERPTSQHISFIFGKITTLQLMGNYISFQAVKIIVITFFPFSFSLYSSGEYFEIYKEHKGLISVQYIFALTKAYIPNIACVEDNTQNRLVIATADANVKWRNIEVTTDNPVVVWRVFSGDGTPIDGWKSTGSAITDVIAGDYILFQFNETTPPTDVKVTFFYIPTNILAGVWTINV
jgi:hypothetical protein